MYRFVLFAGLVLAGCAPAGPPALGSPVSIDLPVAGELIGPRFTATPSGDLVMSWMRRDTPGATLQYALFGESRWYSPVDVISDPKMFVNWADVPSVTHVDGEHWIAHWLSYSAAGTYSYDVVVSQSFDGGSTWGEALPAHTDGTPTEHGFVSMHRDSDGVALLWLDGRDTGNQPGDDPLDTSMTLRAATITPDGERLREQRVDDTVCDCCQTDVAVSSAGPIAVYRDRAAGEIRDIYITRYADGRWASGERLFEDDWVIPGCPVNGPSIAADGDRVAIAWFSAAGNRPVVRVLISADGGATFGTPLEIAATRVAGFVGTAILDGNAVAVSWVGKNDDGTQSILLRALTAQGMLGPVLTVGDTRQARVFPQLARQGGSLVLAWTDNVDDVSRIEAVSVPLGAAD